MNFSQNTVKCKKSYQVFTARNASFAKNLLDFLNENCYKHSNDLSWRKQQTLSKQKHLQLHFKIRTWFLKTEKLLQFQRHCCYRQPSERVGLTLVKSAVKHLQQFLFLIKTWWNELNQYHKTSRNCQSRFKGTQNLHFKSPNQQVLHI